MFKLTTSLWMLLFLHGLADGFWQIQNPLEHRSGTAGWELNKNQLYDRTKFESDGDSAENSKAIAFKDDMNIEKRRQENNPCSCPSIRQVVDFGQGSYPQMHKTVVCDHANFAQNKNTCNSGKCREVYHKLFILKKRPKNKTVEHDVHKLPENIMNEFYLDIQEISIDCHCVRN